MSDSYNIYRSEIISAIGTYPKVEEARLLGSLFAAATKNHITNVCVGFLQELAQEHDLDMTPVLAERILKGCLGRSAAMTTLMYHFSSKGRTASDKSKDFKHLDKIIEENKDKLQKTVNSEKAGLKSVRESAKRKYLIRNQPTPKK